MNLFGQMNLMGTKRCQMILMGNHILKALLNEQPRLPRKGKDLFGQMILLWNQKPKALLNGQPSLCEKGLGLGLFGHNMILIELHAKSFTD